MNLKEVVLNEGLQKIGGLAFYDCSWLENIKFPPTLIEVGDDVFRGCKRLKVVVLNEGLQKIIGDRAFQGCSSLENIHFLPPSPRLALMHLGMLLCSSFLIFQIGDS
ncbi:hypothetical protein ACHAXR_006095 [Thalassiosira sp. AJA248-18]